MTSNFFSGVTDEQLNDWAAAVAPTVPGKLQEWTVMVNSEKFPLIRDQRLLVQELLDNLDASNVELIDHRPVRISLPNERARRETIPDVPFIPTTAGKPVWWRVRFAWRQPSLNTEWPAIEYVPSLPLQGNPDLVELSQGWTEADEPHPFKADVLLDSVGGKLEDAPESDSTLDRIVDGIGDINDTAVETSEAIRDASKGIAVALTVGALVYFASKLSRTKRTI